MTRPPGALTFGTNSAIVARVLSVVPRASVAPESCRAIAVAATSTNDTARGVLGLTPAPVAAPPEPAPPDPAPPKPAPPHATPRTIPSATAMTRALLDAERQAIGEHLGKAARSDTTLRLIHSI